MLNRKYRKIVVGRKVQIRANVCCSSKWCFSRRVVLNLGWILSSKEINLLNH